MRVLIVDDHVLFRDGLMSLLRSVPKYDVVGEAGTVSQAVQVARETRPDLILMDFSLPDGTGLEATQAIRADLPDCKIVFLTIYDTDEKLFAAIRQGAAGYLLKSMPIEDLLANLEALERGEAAISRTMTARILVGFSQTQEIKTDRREALVELTPRELDVLREIVRGASNREIANHLFLSIHTVKHYVNSILSKLGLPNRREAARFASRCGLE